MSCADPETFIWRACYYGSSSKTPFKWRFAGGPNFSCYFVELCSLYDCIQSLRLKFHLKCHAGIQKRLSGERDFIGLPAIFDGGLILADIWRGE